MEYGGILRREWSSTALIVVKAEGRTSQASLFRCFPRQLSMTFSMTLLGAMNSHIQAKRVCPSGNRTRDLPLSVQVL